MTNLFVGVLLFSLNRPELPLWVDMVVLLSLPFLLASTSLALAVQAVRTSERRTPGRAYAMASVCISVALFAGHTALLLPHWRPA